MFLASSGEAPETLLKLSASYMKSSSTLWFVIAKLGTVMEATLVLVVCVVDRVAAGNNAAIGMTLKRLCKYVSIQGSILCKLP